MHIAKIVKQRNQVALVFYDECLNILEEQSFADTSSLNFFLQTLPRKHNLERTLLVIYDKKLDSLDMQIAVSENSYFIG
jgi:hypothetical protein